ncbi:MAG: NADH-quinone oxidoreductase subunit M [Candidatus Aminicenantes bacterium]|nr:NADH-quinone oxidoreductase subunit M [Candidatus Aminicenantes bacterium]
MNAPLLSLIVFLPLAGALLVIFIPRGNGRLLRALSLAAALLVFALSIVLYFAFDAATPGPQFVEQRAWLGYGIRYHLGVDGLSLALVMLTAFLVPVAILASWGSVRERAKEFAFFLLVLETGMLGVFVSLNLFLFYVFWETVLIPMYFLIGIWGGPRRVYATVKFVLFTMAGSLLMLAAIFVLYGLYHEATGTYSLTLADYAGLVLSPGIQTWLFLAFALAFAVKVPLFPLHTWLPDAHVEAPTPASVILAAVLLKMGAYGFVRFAVPLFPDAAARFTPALSILAVVGIVYGGFMALVQKDMKALVAYSSVSHMGLIMLAVFALNPTAMEGGLLQMVNHGLSTGALFLCVGVLYDRTHTRLIADYGGVAKVMPVFAAVLLISSLSSAGLPGLNGFAGEILCFFGTFTTRPVLAAIAVSTVILSAAYLLNMYQKVMHGPVRGEKVVGLRDLSFREGLMFVPIIVLMFWLGLAPGAWLRKMDATVDEYFSVLKAKAKAAETLRDRDFKAAVVDLENFRERP